MIIQGLSQKGKTVKSGTNWSTMTANLHNASSIDFQNGMTDAALQEYRHSFFFAFSPSLYA